MNFLVLSRLFLNPGTMCTSLAGCQMLNGSISISSAGYSWPPAARNIRSNFWPVAMKGSGCISYVSQVETSEGAPQLDVAPAYAMAFGTCPLSTICLMFFSDRFAAVSQLGGDCFFQPGGEGNCSVNTWCVRALAGCQMLNGSISISSAGYSWPPAARNIRSDFWPVAMKGSGCILYVLQVDTSEGAPQLDVAPASTMAVGTCPLSTICLMVFSDRFAAVSQLGSDYFVQPGGEGNCGVNTCCVGDGCDNFGCSSTCQSGGTSGGGVWYVI